MFAFFARVLRRKDKEKYNKKRVFEANSLIIDNDFDIRTDFIESFNMKYRECESMINQVAL